MIMILLANPLLWVKEFLYYICAFHGVRKSRLVDWMQLSRTCRRSSWHMGAKAKRKSKHKRAHLTPLPPPLDILTHLTLTPDCVIRLLMGPRPRELATISSVVRTEQWFIQCLSPISRTIIGQGKEQVSCSGCDYSPGLWRMIHGIAIVLD